MSFRRFSIVLMSAVLATLAHADSYSSQQCPNFATTEQPYLYLYTEPGFTGDPLYVTNASIPDLRNVRLAAASSSYFNDKASSVRLRGRWRICTSASYGGQCVDVSSDDWKSEEMVSSLADRFGDSFEDSISSIKLLGCAQY